MTYDGIFGPMLCSIFGHRPNPLWNVGLRPFCPRCYETTDFRAVHGPEMPFTLAFKRSPEQSHEAA